MVQVNVINQTKTNNLIITLLIYPEIMKLIKLILALFFVLQNISALAQEFEIYVSDAGNFNNPPWKILKYDENGQNPEVFINQNLAWPQDILFLEDEDIVLISNLNSGNIGRYNASTGAFINNFATNIGGPTRMKIGPDNLLYVLQWSGNGFVLRYELDGTFVDEFTSVGVSQSIGLDWDSNNNLFVSSFGGSFIRKFDQLGNNLGTISGNMNGPTDIWIDSNDNIFVNDWVAGVVRRFNSGGSFLGNFINGLSQPEGVDFLPNGNILLGNGGTGSIRMYNANGTFIQNIVASGSGGLLQPNAVRIRPLNNLSNEDLEIETSILKSNMGTMFHLDSRFNSIIDTIEIFNSIGLSMGKSMLKDEIIWDASNHPVGLYIIKLVTLNGKVHTEKVIVKY